MDGIVFATQLGVRRESRHLLAIFIVLVTLGTAALLSTQLRSKQALQKASGQEESDRGQQSSHPVAVADSRSQQFNPEAAMSALDSIIDAAKDEDWELVRSHFSDFQRSVHPLPSPDLKHPDVSLALIDFFDLYHVQLQRAIDDEDATSAVFACNQLDGIISDLQVQLNRATVPELGRLRFLGRDLRYWAERGDEGMLRVRAAGLEKTWDDLRPVVVALRGQETAAKFDLIVSQLKAARSIQEYREIVPALEPAIRNIQTAFSDRE